MKAQKKDSGLLCFRLSEKERDELKELLKSAKKRLNKGRKKDEYVITQNEILFEAVKLGLPLIKKQ